jgi:hypothetical protein
VTFTVDTYAIPPLPQCDEREPDPARVRSIAKTPPPVPPDWTVTITPNQLQLVGHHALQHNGAK